MQLDLTLIDQISQAPDLTSQLDLLLTYSNLLAFLQQLSSDHVYDIADCQSCLLVDFIHSYIPISTFSVLLNYIVAPDQRYPIPSWLSYYQSRLFYHPNRTASGYSLFLQSSYLLQALIDLPNDPLFLKNNQHLI